jgi:hypothetical protein
VNWSFVFGPGTLVTKFDNLIIIYNKIRVYSCRRFVKIVVQIDNLWS